MDAIVPGISGQRRAISDRRAFIETPSMLSWMRLEEMEYRASGIDASNRLLEELPLPDEAKRV
jgi:hypothetical protein